MPPTPTRTRAAVHGMPEIVPGDDLAARLRDGLAASGLELHDRDVVVVCQKVVSKAEGRIVDFAGVTPSAFARSVAAHTGKDPRVVEVVLAETTRIVKMADGHLICETGPGWVCANAGVDESNAARPGTVTLLPVDPDASAARLDTALGAAAGVAIGVVISDTFGRPWRDGLVEVALGVAGIGALLDFAGTTDRGGRPLQHTVVAVADELASAAGLLMAKDVGVPAVLVRGFDAAGTTGRGAALIRPRALDLFR